MRTNGRWGARILVVIFVALTLFSACDDGRGDATSDTTRGVLRDDDAAAPGPLHPSSTLLRRAIAREGAPGAIFAVRQGDDFDVAAVGMADLAEGRAMAADHHFFIGSATKMFTAVLLLQLVDEGLLSLDDALAAYRPEFPRADRITLRQLLNHTSGISDYAVYLYYRPWEELIAAIGKEWTVEEMLEVGGRLEPFGAPGELFAYSATNYALIGAILEQVSGRSFQVLLRERVLGPLAMDDTWMSAWEPARGEVEVTGYLGPVDSWPHGERFGELGPTRFLDATNFTWAAGGMISTAADATTFLEALSSGALLSEAMTAEMERFLPTPSLGGVAAGDEESFYGLGLIKGVRPGYTMIGHGGLFNGYSTLMVNVPDCAASVALFVNRGFINMRAVLDEMIAGLECA